MELFAGPGHSQGLFLDLRIPLFGDRQDARGIHNRGSSAVFLNLQEYCDYTMTRSVCRHYGRRPLTVVSKQRCYCHQLFQLPDSLGLSWCKRPHHLVVEQSLQGAVIWYCPGRNFDTYATSPIKRRSSSAVSGCFISSIALTLLSSTVTPDPFNT